jgi:hypothetical protein
VCSNFCLPDKRNVTRQVSLGIYNLRRDPLATNSTNPSERPALCKNGKNCLDFGISYKGMWQVTVKYRYIK